MSAQVYTLVVSHFKMRVVSPWLLRLQSFVTLARAGRQPRGPAFVEAV